MKNCLQKASEFNTPIQRKREFLFQGKVVHLQRGRNVNTFIYGVIMFGGSRGTADAYNDYCSICSPCRQSSDPSGWNKILMVQVQAKRLNFTWPFNINLLFTLALTSNSCSLKG